MHDRTTIDDRPEDDIPRLPDLTLVRKLGQGSYGQVWLAANKVTGGAAAVKVVALGGPDASRRVARELASLIRYEADMRGQHPNLLAIYHVGQTDAFLYYTMDLADDVAGQAGSLDADYRPATLADRMRNAPLAPGEALEYARQLLAGLAHIHEAGLAHRDVKPANCVFVDGSLRVADFGLLTQTDSTASLVGTPLYMPPDGRMDARADVYAAGLVIYEMLSGLPASAFPRLGEAATEHRSDPAFRALNQLVLRACDPDPNQRFQDAGEMLDALQRPRARVHRSGRRRVARWLVPAAVLLLLTVAALFFVTAPREAVTLDFITRPFEAEVYIDGERAVDAEGRPYRTPCTITGLDPGRHHVVFRKEGRPDLVVGEMDFSAGDDVTATWPDAER